jgi:hypothetical protein
MAIDRLFHHPLRRYDAKSGLFTMILHILDRPLREVIHNNVIRYLNGIKQILRKAANRTILKHFIK